MSCWNTLPHQQEGLQEHPAVGHRQGSKDSTCSCGCTALLCRGLPVASPGKWYHSPGMQYYRQLDAPERLALFRGLTDGLGVQAAEVDAAAAAWQQLRQQQQQAGSGAPDADGHHQEHSGSSSSAPSSTAAPDLLLKAAERLAGAATPLYARLFVPISQQPGGIKFLVDLRAELLQVGWGCQCMGKHPGSSLGRLRCRLQGSMPAGKA